ncbi:MAG: hypothetical protein IJW31_03555 [Lentisphaeria bacterium]|nr:hypothetical protein [Lentisphaeria bacterium]MBR7127998.1 hypothetical protein [Lentisphaeria bacterium]
MLKKIVVFFVAVSAMFIISGCSIGRYDNNYKTLKDMTNHFLMSDLDIDAVQPLMPFFRAQGGCSFLIDGTEIGIYKYEVVSGIAAPKAKEKLDDIYDKGYVYIEGLKYPVLLNGTFMLIGYEKNQSRNKIIEVFNSFE